MALHNDGDYVAVLVPKGVLATSPCALVSTPGSAGAAVPAQAAAAADSKKVLVGWLHPNNRDSTGRGDKVLAAAQYTGTFVSKMSEPDGWKYGDGVWWSAEEGLTTTTGKGVFVGWLLECKFNFARVQIDANGWPGDI